MGDPCSPFLRSRRSTTRGTACVSRCLTGSRGLRPKPGRPVAGLGRIPSVLGGRAWSRHPCRAAHGRRGGGTLARDSPPPFVLRERLARLPRPGRPRRRPSDAGAIDRGARGPRSHRGPSGLAGLLSDRPDRRRLHPTTALSGLTRHCQCVRSAMTLHPGALSLPLEHPSREWRWGGRRRAVAIGRVGCRRTIVAACSSFATGIAASSWERSADGVLARR